MTEKFCGCKTLHVESYHLLVWLKQSKQYLWGTNCALFSKGYSFLPILSDFIINTFSVELSNEKKLIKTLLKNYEDVTPHGRPVINISNPITVKFGLGLIQMELDEKEKALSLSLWAKYVSLFFSPCCANVCHVKFNFHFKEIEWNILSFNQKYFGGCLIKEGKHISC